MGGKEAKQVGRSTCKMHNILGALQERAEYQGRMVVSNGLYEEVT